MTATRMVRTAAFDAHHYLRHVHRDRFLDARTRIGQLHTDLQSLVDRDPDQEVWEDVIPVLDAVIAVVRAALPDDPVLREVHSFYTTRATSERELRAAEALLIVGQVRAAVPPPPPPRVAGF
ncbi:MAG: hypothetical protein LC799_19670 [Actinobacteria bacterium]|nr:hypothetical protein [Actinomycetota bacterium]